MFNFNNNAAITKVLNPLKVTRSSLIEFNIGELRDKGLWRFKKIIEFNVGGKSYTRYLVYSKSEDNDCIIEVFPTNNDQFETYVYKLKDTVPFSEDFLDVAGQRFLNTPDGLEYLRCALPDDEGRLDGLKGNIKVYNIETGDMERESQVTLWDYQRDADGKTEFLNIEMAEENGMFRIFVGEMIENIFYKFYQTSK